MPTDDTTKKERYLRRLKRRKASESRFKFYGIVAIGLAFAFLAFFFFDIFRKGYSAMAQAKIHVELDYNDASAKMFGGKNAIPKEYQKIVSRGETRIIPNKIKNNPELLGTTEKKWILADVDVDQYLKGKSNDLKEDEIAFVEQLKEDGTLALKFNSGFFTNGDSKLPEMAGIKVAILGTIQVLFITLIVALPIGVMTSVYLEEFAPDNKFTQTIEVNINNLAAIPSIMFGLLGLAVVINFFGVPRSSALAAGITLGLMMLPVIIISTRAALRAVPNSIREGAYGIGASGWQVVLHHVLPLSIPGILTGSIISLARALGETAPLIIVGLMAYIADPPSSILDGTTVLPAQLYTWTTESELAYQERAAAGIVVLMIVLLTMNATAIWMRNKTERRW